MQLSATEKMAQLQASFAGMMVLAETLDQVQRDILDLRNEWRRESEEKWDLHERQIGETRYTREVLEDRMDEATEENRRVLEDVEDNLEEGHDVIKEIEGETQEKLDDVKEVQEEEKQPDIVIVNDEVEEPEPKKGFFSSFIG